MLRTPRTAYILRVFASAAVLSAAPLISAQTSGTLIVKFLDSRTGTAVAPRALEVDGKPTPFQLEAGSLATLALPDGTHKIGVKAEGYAPMEVSATVAGANTPVVEIELDPNGAPTAAPLPEGAAALEGTVTDADTGSPIEKAKVTLPDSGLTTTTATTGQFRFILQPPRSTADSKTVISMEVAAEGYTPQRVKNLAIIAGETRRSQVRLTRADADTSDTIEETDEAAADGPLRSYEWVYDVTLR